MLVNQCVLLGGVLEGPVTVGVGFARALDNIKQGVRSFKRPIRRCWELYYTGRRFRLWDSTVFPSGDGSLCLDFPAR